MTKTPIKHEDVRVGDLIRAEWADGETATEARVTEGSWFREDRTLFLLDRPEPPYELPTEPGVYTIADTTADIPNMRVFMLGVYRSGKWTEGRETVDLCDGKPIEAYLLEKKWPLKRLVIED